MQSSGVRVEPELEDQFDHDHVGKRKKSIIGRVGAGGTTHYKAPFFSSREVSESLLLLMWGTAPRSRHFLIFSVMRDSGFFLLMMMMMIHLSFDCAVGLVLGRKVVLTG